MSESLLPGMCHESDIVFKCCMAIPHVPPRCPGKTWRPGSPTTSLGSSNFWMIIPTASLWEQTVGSRQVQQICMSICGKAVMPTGKNIEVHEAIPGHLENGPALEELSPHVHKHVGFTFTREDLT